jgi:hypothetical protein
MTSERGRDRLCWGSLIFKKNFLFSVLSDLSVLMTTRPIYYSQVSFLTQPALVVVVLTAYTNRLEKNLCKNSCLETWSYGTGKNSLAMPPSTCRGVGVLLMFTSESPMGAAQSRGFRARILCFKNPFMPCKNLNI